MNFWDFSHDGQDLPDVVPDLASAMTLNPGLKVLSLNGFHDLATPYFQTSLDLSRIGNFTAIQVRGYSLRVVSVALDVEARSSSASFLWPSRRSTSARLLRAIG